MKGNRNMTEAEVRAFYDKKLIRFDWAIKRLLRQKANFVVLEGLLSVLMGDSVKIVRMLSEESNKETADDKFNRVDMLAETEKNGLVIVEVQNQRELDYFHRMLYGTSKVVTEYIEEKEKYETIKKIYSLNILYFSLGQGVDFLYRGRTDFRGVFKKDLLLLTKTQQENFKPGKEPGDLYPEYYILRVEDFNKKAVTPLEEWFSFLKTGVIPENAKAPGLPEARTRLLRDKLSKEERADYEAHINAVVYQNSVIKTSRIEGKAEGKAEGEAIGLKKGIAKGKAEGIARTALKMVEKGIPFADIRDITGLSIFQIEKLDRTSVV
jgi:predicted transposase/invertase (TIGR01784 family)